jgi:hypothetical protein
MPFNGSGTYSLPAGNPVVTGTTISSSTTNNTNTDIATALTNCLTRDGQSTPSANLPMNAKKLTGLAAGTSAGDSVRYEQVLLLAGGTMTGNIVFNAGQTFTGTLPLTGGTMTGAIVFNAGQTISGYLPTTGGTMTGDIVFASGQVFSNWIYKNSTYNPAVVGDAILADTSAGAFTITLPASPSQNDYIAIADYAGAFSVNNLTINSNSLKIMGYVQNFILDVAYRNVTLVYSGSTQGWVIVL